MPDSQKSPAELLIQAIDALPKEERDRVLVWLLDPPPRSGRAAWTMHAHASGLASRVPELPPQMREALRRRVSGTRDELQAVPVRLTADQHAVLRQWCQEHQFSMATVIRGLVSQFLEKRGLEEQDLKEHGLEEHGLEGHGLEVQSEIPEGS